MVKSRLASPHIDHISGNPAIAVLVSTAARERGVTQEELAAMLHVSRSQISRIMSGSRNPSCDVLIKLCYELEITIEELYIAMRRAEEAGITSGMCDEDVVFTEVRAIERGEATSWYGAPTANR